VRAGVEHAVSPHPLGATLPALYADDSFAQRWCAALDEVVAPVIGVLDAFGAYLDPWTTPADVLDWLASWVGLDAAAALPEERRRALVAQAADLHAWRGTPAAVRGLVQLATGRDADLEESGGTMWSADPGTALPGSGRPGLVVRVRRADPGSGADDVDPGLLRTLLTLVAPAHVPWSVEVD
jgi:phage tail-like protein